MSGGSFNYLCWADNPFTHDGGVQLESMIERIGQYSPRTKDDIQDLVNQYNELTVKISKYHDLFRAVEWYVSCDCSEKVIYAELAKL